MNYDYIVKQRARKELKKFIQKNLGHRRLDEIKVLCLPGEQCLEIKLYDDIGIKRENIVGLERDEKAFSAIEAMALGIEIHRKTFHEFTQTAFRQRFDIVSLDFMGKMKSNCDDIATLIGKQNISDEAIIYTNFFAGREKDHEIEFYTDIIYWLKKAEVGFEPGDHSDEIGTDLWHKKRQGREAAFRKGIEKNGVDKNRSLAHRLVLAYSILMAEAYFHRVDNQPDQIIKNLLRLEKSMLEKPGYEKIDGENNFVVALHDPIRLYRRHIEDHISYSYTNAGGTKMLSEMVFVKKSKELHRLKQIFGDMDYESPGLYKKGPDLFHRIIENEDREFGWIRAAHEWVRTPNVKKMKVFAFRKMHPGLFPITRILSNMNTRTHFGNESSYRMSPGEAKKFVKKNYEKDSKWLAKETGLPIRKIAAWKAHITMGTYD